MATRGAMFEAWDLDSYSKRMCSLLINTSTKAASFSSSAVAASTPAPELLAAPITKVCMFWEFWERMKTLG